MNEATELSDRAGTSGAGIGRAVYNVVWSVLALQVFLLLSHLAGSMLFAVEDVHGIIASLLGFSLVVWLGGSIVLLPLVMAGLLRRLAEAASRPEPEPFVDEWLDV
ncbi:MAG: hypothetical protein U0835_12775 [Isosphaeraceae bacterium]